MAEDRYNQLVGKKFIGVSVLLAFAFWAVFTRLLLPFVPAETIGLQYLFSGYTAACLTGVFFLATHMFWTVFREQQMVKREQA